MEPVELEPRPDDGSGGCRAAIALTVAAACLPLMLGVFAPALRSGRAGRRRRPAAGSRVPRGRAEVQPHGARPRAEP